MTPLTPEQIAELKALEAKVPKGPWERETIEGHSAETVRNELHDDGGKMLFESSNSPMACVEYECDEYGTDYFDSGTRDLYDFIAALRNAAPALLAAARREAKYREALEQIANFGGISSHPHAAKCNTIARTALGDGA